VGILGLSLVGSLFNVFLITPVSRATAEMECKEGDFRYRHANVRSDAEAIAFSDAGKVEGNLLNEDLDHLLVAQSKVYNRLFFLNLSMNLYAYIGAIFSFPIIAVPIFTGVYDDKTDPELSEIISVNTNVCFNLLGTFTSLINMSGTVSEICGVTHR